MYNIVDNIPIIRKIEEYSQWEIFIIAPIIVKRNEIANAFLNKFFFSIFIFFCLSSFCTKLTANVRLCDKNLFSLYS